MGNLEVYNDINVINRRNANIGTRTFSIETIKEDLDRYSNIDIIKAYCLKLEEILEENDLYIMIDQIFILEESISFINNDLEAEKSFDLPCVESIYKQFTPLILRSIVYAKGRIENDGSVFLKELQEALRVSLEHELYYWEDKK